jgi:hypothetical protein
MTFRRYLMALRCHADSVVFRIVACTLILCCSVAIIAVCVWDGAVIGSKRATLTTVPTPKPARLILRSQTKSHVLHEYSETELDAPYYGDGSSSSFLQQERDETKSIAFAVRMCIPPAVSIALQQTINEPVNDRLDTMLHVACQTRDIVTIIYLIDAGADVNVRNRLGETPLDLIDYTEREHVESITRIIGHRSSKTPGSAETATHCG